jgi:hypothetical protein
MLDQLNGSKVTTELTFHHPSKLRDWEMITELPLDFFVNKQLEKSKRPAV